MNSLRIATSPSGAPTLMVCRLPRDFLGIPAAVRPRAALMVATRPDMSCALATIVSGDAGEVTLREFKFGDEEVIFGPEGPRFALRDAVGGTTPELMLPFMATFAPIGPHSAIHIVASDAMYFGREFCGALVVDERPGKIPAEAPPATASVWGAQSDQLTRRARVYEVLAETVCAAAAADPRFAGHTARVGESHISVGGEWETFVVDLKPTPGLAFGTVLVKAFVHVPTMDVQFSREYSLAGVKEFEDGTATLVGCAPGGSNDDSVTAVYETHDALLLVRLDVETAASARAEDWAPDYAADGSLRFRAVPQLDRGLSVPETPALWNHARTFAVT